jgi:hypothetical protein
LWDGSTCFKDQDSLTGRECTNSRGFHCSLAGFQIDGTVYKWLGPLPLDYRLTSSFQMLYLSVYTMDIVSLTSVSHTKEQCVHMDADAHTTDQPCRKTQSQVYRKAWHNQKLTVVSHGTF